MGNRMRLAIFSDVHGNLTALKTVLDDIDHQPSVDHVLFAGDLCVFGPRPLACLDVIRQRSIASIAGNTDQWISNPPPLQDRMDEAQRNRIKRIWELCSWTQAQLGPENMAWFAQDNLPFQRRISPSSTAHDDLLLVHANPLDVNQIIFPDEEYQRKLYGRVRQTDAQLAEMIQGTDAAVIAFGHLHIPNARQYQHLLLANISSVSLPGDGDPRAKYGLLTWQRGQGWSVEHICLTYPVEPEIEAFRQAQPPGWEQAVTQLEVQGFVPQVV